MNKELIQRLKQVYQAPEPVGKEKILWKTHSRKISLWNMLLIQIRYISLWTWIASVGLFLSIVIFSYMFDSRMMGAVFSLTPFLVMVSVSESVRSITYGMKELELSARFSLKSVMMAKMGILGSENLLILILSALMIPRSFWQNALYLLVPYLLTAFGNLAIVRRWAGKEAIYACGGLAALVSVIGTIITTWYPRLFDVKAQNLWGLALIGLMVLTIREGYKIIQKTEELAWN